MKIKRLSQSIPFSTRIVLALLSVLIVISIPMQLSSRVSADQYDDQINALQQELDAAEARASELQAQADTYRTAIARLQSQIDIIQAQINVSQAEFDKLTAQIADTEKKITDNKDALGKTIADIYVDDDITPLEMLASSNSISDFIDKQEYRSSIQSELTATINEIKDLKTKLEKQKADVQVVMDKQKAEQDNLASTRQLQQNLLDRTNGEESLYQQLASQKRQSIEQVRAEQQLYFASLAAKSGGGYSLLDGDPNKGGYPSYLANSYQDSIVDPWGMYNRECVSYTAWKVHQAYGNMPYWGGIGNAWEWAFSGWASTDYWNYGSQVDVGYADKTWHTANAESYGIPYGSEPKAGSVAVSNGQYGHVAWVEAVMGDQIKISQYNWYVASLGGWGQYSEMIVNKSTFQRYIYFGEW